MKQHHPLQVPCLFIAAYLLSGCAGFQQQPEARRDYWPTEGWQEATPEEAGMDPALLSELSQHIEEGMPQIFSVLIVRDGYLVFQYYQDPYFIENPRSVQSITKSFTSALIGIALREGYLSSLDQKMIDFFPEYDSADLDPRLREVTLRHLLTMTAGFTYPSGTGQPPIEAKLQEGMISEPGQSFAYDGGATQLLSAILTKTTGMTALEFANEYLFGPLGISNLWWGEQDEGGYSNGAYGLIMVPDEMAKFGYLYLNHGVWDGEQIIPRDYVEESTQAHSEGGPPENAAYGYQWWVTTVEEHPAYFAAGYGGQYIYVIPDLDTVIVITSNSGRYYEENIGLVDTYIVPAIIDRGA